MELLRAKEAIFKLIGQFHYADKVFSTDSIKSAKMYAKKACEKYGGKSIVYIVEPIGNIIYNINHECMSDKALIIKILNKNN